MTLIEIMVALVISLFLLAGLLQMFIATRQSSRIQENLSRVQENGRFGIEYINRVIRQAGYRSRATILNGEDFKQKFNVDRIGGTDNDGTNSSDRVIVRFEGENVGQGEVRNCLNQSISSPAISIDTLSIDSNNNLQCQAVTPVGAAPQTQPILENMEDIQVLYGEKKGSNLAYVSAANVQNWDNVFSVRVSLVLRTADDNLVDAPQPYTINGVTTTPPATDRRLRRVFTTTIALRN
ncbi:MAG: PilW family protein [Candidatus Competibacteraceae bacterium]|nr:PilW family protein [Candidatus Competibacteraceae bacterium]